MLTGGGTAGHVWPHFSLFEGNNSLAQSFRANQLKVYYVGSHSGMEKDLVTSTQPTWFYHSVSTGKLRRYFSWQNFIDPFKIFLGFLQAFFLILQAKPSVVFSKGGFVSAPIVWAAWLCRVPVVIHESDATSALATKLTMPFAQRALFAFSDAFSKFPLKWQSKCLEIGLPVRPSLFQANKQEALAYFKLEPDLKIILIFGGSLGAQSLNAKVFDMLPELIEKYQIIHLTGKNNQKELSDYPNISLLKKRYRQYEFLKDEMKLAYAAADLAICRAGASSLFELVAARIPMILIPLGLNASRGDQIINARIFSKKGWAQWIDEQTFQKETAVKLIDSTVSCLEDRKQALTEAPGVESAQNVANLLWGIIIKNENKS